MLPLILVSKNKKDTVDFLRNFIKENKIAKDRVYTISPVKNEILISQIREMKKEIKYSSRFPRLFIFYNFYIPTL